MTERRYEGWRITRWPHVECPLESHGVHEPAAEFLSTGTLRQASFREPVSVFCINCQAPFEFELVYSDN